MRAGADHAAGRSAARLITFLVPLALVALVLAPLWPTLAWLRAHPVPRFALQGDYASLEAQTRLVPTGETLLGPYSRFGFNHPGPAYFFVLWPFVAAGGVGSTGLFVGPLAISALSAVAIVIGLVRHGSLAHATGGALVLLAWMMAFGNATAMPWNPAVIALPMLGFAVYASFVAAGRPSALPVALAFGVFVSQTHLSCVPYVGGITVVSVGAWWLRLRRAGQRPSRSARSALVASLAVLVVSTAPVVIEELEPDGGNLTKVAHLFTHRPEAPKPWSEALSGFEQAAAWLPRRAESGSIATEPNEPEPLWSTPFGAAGKGTRARTAVWLALLCCAAAVAWRRRDVVGLALLGSAAAGAILAISGLRGVIGEPFRYLHFWATTPTTLGWMGIATTITSAAADLARRLGVMRRAVSAALAGVLAALLGAGTIRAVRLVEASVAVRGAGVPVKLGGLPEAYAALERHLREAGAVPVLHGGLGWFVNADVVLERMKDARPIRVIPGERWLFGRQFPPPAPGERVLHVYAQHVAYPIELAKCLAPAGSSGEVAFYVSETDVTACPP